MKQVSIVRDSSNRFGDGLIYWHRETCFLKMATWINPINPINPGNGKNRGVLKKRCIRTWGCWAVKTYPIIANPSQKKRIFRIFRWILKDHRPSKPTTGLGEQYTELNSDPRGRRSQRTMGKGQFSHCLAIGFAWRGYSISIHPGISNCGP